MKSAAVVALSLLIAAPSAVAVAPSPAEAQVLAGSNAARRVAPRRPGLSDRDRERLYAAQDRQIEHETKIAELTAITEAGGVLSEQQTRELAQLQRRLADTVEDIERLEAKNERLGG
ncbi:hypothetical protein ACO2Q1_13235 [Brevundimonas sp. VNH65]|uniref:hypothetical protein n=1 Tax=Brevundimonas sp. VNH65 TaxID=3400917 RepID=UPI003BFF94D6